RGGITIDDEVFIAPKVNLITINHDINPFNRSTTICKPIHIEKRVWIGVAATILPSVRIGENSIVGANALVSKDVPPNSVVGGNPARIIKSIDIEKYTQKE
uniref:acyltransferase n=1 Tax=uncultured Helicobacter sp. TaxID=175537 RepID=UPI0037516D38